MSLKNNLIDVTIKYANMLIHTFPITSKPLLFIIFFILINIFLTTSKLGQFSNPKYPKGSLILREIASALNIISTALVILTLLYFLTIFTLVFFAFLLSESPQSSGFFNQIAFTSKQLWTSMHSILLTLISGSILGIITGLYLKYFLIPDLEKGEGLKDVEDIQTAFHELNGFDPTKYIDTQKGCFIGATLDRKAIYIPWKKIRETHIQILGATSSGKGAVMSLIAYQSILAGENLIWFDPKFDRFSPRVLADAAKKAKKDFYLINLNSDQSPQLNPIAGASAYEIEELLVTAFDLKGKGTDGDFHRAKDEGAAIEASKLAISKNAVSIPQIIQVCRSIESITSQENFWGKLLKLGDLNAIKTNKGLNLEAAIKKGAVIYIIGSTDNERVKMLLKLLLVRVIQIIKKQDRFKENAPNCMVLDEFKHILSPASLNALGVIRDFNTHCLLAHQTLGDLDSCAGITRAEAEGAVLDNTTIKIIYRIGDSTYAEKLSKNSGKKRVFVEQAGKGLDKNNNPQGSWKESNIPLIDTDVFTHLPMPSDRTGQASVGVLLGVGLSKLFFTGPVPTISKMPAVTVAPEVDSQLNTNGDLDDII